MSVLGPALLYFMWYDDFFAITPRGATTELIYLWPRPARTINTTEISDIQVETKFGGRVQGVNYYVSRLRFTAGSQTWTSHWGRNGGLATKARETILRTKGAR